MLSRNTSKRVVDVFGSALALVVVSPLLATLAALVRTRIGSPVLFRQFRPGIKGEPFRLVKFRTMTDDTTPDGELLPDEERLVETGRWLRRWSLDELPELWNVLVGEMSLVGPRPLLMEYLPRYTDDQARRHDVRPGLTGLAQIAGRNDVSWERRFELDLWYIDNWSIWLDVRILATTIRQVRTGRGVSQEGHATMRPFEGSTGQGRSRA